MSILRPPFDAANRSIPEPQIDHVDLGMDGVAIITNADIAEKVLGNIQQIQTRTRSGMEIPAFSPPRITRRATWISAMVNGGGAGNIKYPIKPIFGGRLSSVSPRGQSEKPLPGEHVRLGLDLKLNNNHFHMAQDYSRMLRLGNRTLLGGSFATAIEHRFAKYGNEYCLTDEDNVLIGPAQVDRYVASKSSEKHLIDNLRVCEKAIWGGLGGWAEYYGARTAPIPYYPLRGIEHYWEFFDPSPIRLVDSLVMAMRSLGDESRCHRAMVRGERVRVRQSSLSIQVELSAGCLLIAYAKTNERVRFEIRLNRYAISQALGGSIVSHDHEALREAVKATRLTATERFIGALRDLDRMRAPPEPRISARQLCTEIGRLISSRPVADLCIETLWLRGSIASPLGSPLRSAVDILVNEGILRRRLPRHPVFVPTDAYVAAVAQLREQL